MMVRVGVIDSGGPAVEAGCALGFAPDGSARPAGPDRLGHGTAVAGMIRRAVPGAVILSAQVFDDRPVTSALRVAAGLRWLVGFSAPPDLVCLSLGLAADRAVLRAAIAEVMEAGLVIVAAHPARGGPCYPAAYPGVIAATGDARCGWEEISQLGPELFGAWCNSPERGGGGMAGASLGAARLAGHLAAIAAAEGGLASPAAARSALARRARHFGPERRRAG